MKILKIIHGYPPAYNAGSEVYTQTLCLALAKYHEVTLFAREENPFAQDFTLRETCDAINPKIKLHLINIPLERQRYRYRQTLVDKQLDLLLDRVKPDIVHIGHLNHLSTSLIYPILARHLPIVYTLHDYWLLCPRGQFIQRNGTVKDLWTLCDGQEDEKCARQCYAGYFSGNEHNELQEVTYWSRWVQQRMQHIQQIVSHIDLLIAPSQYLRKRFQNVWNIPDEKIIYLDYGFALKGLQKPVCSNRQRPFTFGYMGTHIPAKGIQHLIQAFAQLKGETELHIWGRARAQNTPALKMLVEQLPAAIRDRIIWREEYANSSIAQEVFQTVDSVVVPSIWVENSPLVIHEALQARIPVITADAGGMAEYIKHEVNGLLFQHRNPHSLAEQMQRFVDDPFLAQTLGNRGYWQNTSGNVCSIEEHTRALEIVYKNLITRGNLSHEQRTPKSRTLANHF